MPRRKFRLPEDHPAARYETSLEGLEDREDINEQGKRRTANQVRHAALRSADMARISALLLQGASPEDIAKEIGISVRTVLEDIKHLNRLWVNEIRDNHEQFRTVCISKLMKLEALALESFHQSKERTVTDHTTHADGSVSRSVKTFHSAGDPAFLNVAKDAIKQQVTVLGLDGPVGSSKGFDKEAFLDAVAEKIAECKLAAESMPTMAQELKQAQDQAAQAGCPF